MINLNNLGIEKIKQTQLEKEQAIKKAQKEAYNKIQQAKRKAFLHGVVCFEYGLENLDIALDQTFKSEELDGVRKSIKKIKDEYVFLRSKLDKFTKIEENEMEYNHIKDMFEMVMDSILKGQVKFE